MTSDNWEGLRYGGMEGGNNTDVNLERMKHTHKKKIPSVSFVWFYCIYYYI